MPETEVIPVLSGQPAELENIFTGIPEERGTYSYAEGKWSLKEMLGHMIDGERMFAYRVFRISRGDKTPIEGFEQEGYIENAHSNDRNFADLLEEFKLLRRANVLFFNNLNDKAWTRGGTANECEISVRALALIMAGHIRHHINILRERYLVN